MTEIYFPDYVWQNIKEFLFPVNHRIYTIIRNKYLIGNYSIENKCKYGKKINTKKYISEYHTCKNLNTLGWTVFDDYYVCGLLLGNKYKCIDEYVKIIKVYGQSSEKMNPDIHNLYLKFRRYNESFFDKHNGYEGPFYIAMIYLGFQFKIRKNLQNSQKIQFAIK